MQLLQICFTVALGMMLVFGAGLIFKARQRGKTMTTTEMIKRARMAEIAKEQQKCA